MSRFSKTRKFNAVTLLESIIYLALFGAIFLVIIQFAFSIGDTNKTSDLSNEIHRASIFLQEHLFESFKTALAIDTAMSQFEDDKGVLRLTTPTGFIEYTTSNGILSVNRDNVVSPITNANLNVERFNITRINDSEGNAVAAEIEIRISATKDDNVALQFSLIETL